MATISWDKQKREWITHDDNETEPPTICIFMAPLVHAGGVSLMSYGSAALRVWRNLWALTENMRRRDNFNSSHTVRPTRLASLARLTRRRCLHRSTPPSRPETRSRRASSPPGAGPLALPIPTTARPTGATSCSAT